MLRFAPQFVDVHASEAKVSEAKADLIEYIKTSNLTEVKKILDAKIIPDINECYYRESKRPKSQLPVSPLSVAVWYLSFNVTNNSKFPLSGGTKPVTDLNEDHISIVKLLIRQGAKVDTLSYHGPWVSRVDQSASIIKRM